MWEGHTSGPNATFPGAAYLFDSSGASLHTFKPPQPGGYVYGSALALVGNNILILQESAPNGGNLTAYLYDKTSGAPVRTMANLGQQSGVTTPNSHVVAAGGNNVLIGTPGNGGGATLYDTSTGGIVRTFGNPFVTGNDSFGFSVAALPGNRVAVAAPFADRGAIDTGAVYIFDASSGALLHTLLDPHASADGWFGRSIAAVGNSLLVGAPYADLGANNTGAAYLFSADTGDLLHTFLNPTPQDDDWFGQSVAAFGNDFLISAVEDNTVAPQAGAVYRFQGISVPEPSSAAVLMMAVAVLKFTPRAGRVVIDGDGSKSSSNSGTSDKEGGARLS